MSDKKIRLYHKTVLCAVFAVFAAITGIVESLCGIDAFFPILRGISTLEEAMNPENAKQNLIDTAEQAFRLFNICRQA